MFCTIGWHRALPVRFWKGPWAWECRDQETTQEYLLECVPWAPFWSVLDFCPRGRGLLWIMDLLGCWLFPYLFACYVDTLGRSYCVIQSFASPGAPSEHSNHWYPCCSLIVCRKLRVSWELAWTFYWALTKPSSVKTVSPWRSCTWKNWNSTTQFMRLRFCEIKYTWKLIIFFSSVQRVTLQQSSELLLLGDTQE